MVEIFIAKNATPVDTGTLGASTAVLISSVVTNPAVRNFMLKNLNTIVNATFPTVTDHLILLLADSDATVAELATSLNSTSQDMEDSVAYRQGQEQVRRIWDIQAVPRDGIVNGGVVGFQIAWKLPPKGVPVLKGRGLSIFGFNPENAAFSNGPSVLTLSKVMGGWF